MHRVANAKPVRRKLPHTFEGLNRLHPLYVVHDEAGYENARELAQTLMLAERTPGQDAFLESLLVLMAAYEEEHHPIDTSAVTPLSALQFLMEQHGMNGSDLGRLLGTRQLGPAILRGKRKLSKRHIQILCRHFQVRPELFLEKTEA